jgi:hypothetical protein
MFIPNSLPAAKSRPAEVFGQNKPCDLHDVVRLPLSPRLSNFLLRSWEMPESGIFSFGWGKLRAESHRILSIAL